MEDQYVDYRKQLKDAYKNNTGATSLMMLTDKDFNSRKSAEITLKKFGGKEPWKIEEKKNGRFIIVQRFTNKKATWQMTNSEYCDFKKLVELTTTDLRNRKFNIEQALKAKLPVPELVKHEYNL